MIGTLNGHVLFICHDPLDLDRQQWFERLLEEIAPPQLQRALVAQADFEAFLAHAQTHIRTGESLSLADSADSPDAGHDGALHLSVTHIETTINPVVRLVNAMLFDALRCGASDIHFESKARGLQVKFRIDGVLQRVAHADGHEAAAQAIQKKTAVIRFSSSVVPQYPVALCTRLAL